MKFGKRLKKQVEESLPEWRDKFLSYKRLKRLVRLVSAGNSSPRRAATEAVFVWLLDGEVDRFNAFFLEQEEEFVIRHMELQEMVKKVAAGEEAWPSGTAEMRRVRKHIVDLHGEMVLLLNYSAINYTGLAKILKKYDKRTGRLLRFPFIEKVLEQPFFATELISRLVRECEATMEAVFEAERRDHAGGWSRTTPVAVADSEKQGIFRNTVAALVTMRELQRELHVRELLAAAHGSTGAARLQPLAVYPVLRCCAHLRRWEFIFLSGRCMRCGIKNLAYVL